MNEINLALVSGALTKVTILLVVVLVAILLMRRVEPRWRVLLVRAAILAVPIILIAGFLEPQLHFKTTAQERTFSLQDEVVVSSELSPLPVISEGNVEAMASPAITSPMMRIPFGAWLLISWLLIGGVKIAREAWQLRLVFRDAAATQKADADMISHWRSVCREMGIPATQLRVAQSTESPYLTPGLRSTLVIPESLVEPKRRHLLVHVFRHEAAHLRNHDAFWIPAVRMLSCFIWFHPITWWLSSLHLKACEEGADAEAARRGGTESYRGALAKLALEFVPAHSPAVSFLRLPNVKDRLRAIPGHSRRNPPTRWLTLMVSMGLMTFGGLLGTISLAQAESKSPLDLMRSIVIPEIEFQETNIRDALEFLQHKSVELDPDRGGVNLVMDTKAKPTTTVSLTLREITLGQAISHVVRQAGLDLRIDSNAVFVTANGKGNMSSHQLSVDAEKALAQLDQKLRTITIPQLEFRDTPLSDAVDFIRVKSRELDPDRRGINLVRDSLVDGNTPITLKLTRVPLKEALRYTAELSDAQVGLEPNAVVLVPNGSTITPVNTAAAPASDRIEKKDQIRKKLQSIIIPTLEFQEVPLSDGLEFLNAKCGQLDPSSQGVDFIIAKGVQKNAPITLRLSNVPAFEALRYISELAGARVTIEAHAVVVHPVSNELFMEVFQLKEGIKEGQSAKQVLEDAGVQFPPGAAAIFNPANSQLIIRNTEENLQRVEEWIASRKSKSVKNNAPDPSDIWYRAFVLKTEGDKAAEEGMNLVALSKYGESKQLFDHLHQNYPDWNSQLVKYRSDKLGVVIENLKNH